MKKTFGCGVAVRDLLAIAKRANIVLTYANLVTSIRAFLSAPAKILFSLLLVALPASAKSVSFDFQGVSVVAFSQATFKTLLNRDYVISPEVLSLDKKITVSVRSVDERDVPAFVESVLTGQGIAVTEIRGVHYLTIARPVPVESLAAQALPVPSMKQAMPPPPSFVTAPAGDRKEVAPVLSMESDTIIFSPQNRPAEFISLAVAAIYGPTAATSSGALVVLGGSKDQLTKLHTLAVALDVAPLSVDVSVSWVEVARSTNGSRGVSLAADVLGSKLGFSLGTVNAGSVSIKHTNFQMVIEALDTDSRFKQVSNSRMVGDDRLPMSLTVGDETPTIASSGKDNQGNAVQSVIYRPSGVITQVTPKVLGGGRIGLTIEGQISSFKSTSTGVSGSPTLIKREVKTGVTIAPGEVLLIGGLSDEHSTDINSGFSFLPASWGVKNSSGLKTDLVLIVSAKVGAP